MEEITKTVTRLASELDEEGRRKLADGLRDLSYSIETPHDSLQRIMFLQLQLAVVRIGIGLKLFKLLASTDSSMTLEQMQHETKAAPLFLGRLLRYMASFRLVQEAGQDKFAPNNVTKALAVSGYEAGILFLFDIWGPVFQAFPEVLAKNDYKDMWDDTNTAVSAAYNTSLPGILWIQEHEPALTYFNEYMRFHRALQPSCWDVYPVMDGAKDWDPSAVLLIDIGGGQGHQCAEFKSKFPDAPGRVILQDLKGPISTAVSTPGVEIMVYDMFGPQPVEGAKYYYLRNILHDWPDHKCSEILRNIVPAMSSESIILLDEMVLPNQNVHWQAAQSDLATMAALASAERTHKQWTELLDTAGLKIKEVHVYTPLTYQSIMAVVPK